MTDEQIVKIVAEKIMGWTLKNFRTFGDLSAWIKDGTLVLKWFKSCEECGRGGLEQFDPLTNLNHAFMVVEKMREDGFYPNIISLDKDGTEWYVVFKPQSYDSVIVHENLGTAICLAALKTKGVEI